MLRLEIGFLEELRQEVIAEARKAPTNPDGFISWFENLKATGPGQHDRLFPWLAERADRVCDPGGGVRRGLRHFRRSTHGVTGCGAATGGCLGTNPTVRGPTRHAARDSPCRRAAAGNNRPAGKTPHPAADASRECPPAATAAAPAGWALRARW